MKVGGEPSKNDLRGKMLLEMRRLIADIIFVSDRSAEVRKTDHLFKFVQSGQR